MITTNDLKTLFALLGFCSVSQIRLFVYLLIVTYVHDVGVFFFAIGN